MNQLKAPDLDWQKMDDLIPAIIQDHSTKKVLMLGYMNKESLNKTVETGKVTFYSRSKKRLWTKGETSGHFLEVTDIASDCDQDALVIEAMPHGPTCHLGSQSCFGDEMKPGDMSFLVHLEKVIEDRLVNAPEGSYTAKLLAKGTHKVAQKVGEEGVEVALAGAAEGREELINESADLIFHLIVLLRHRAVGLEEVISCLQSRHR